VDAFAHVLEFSVGATESSAGKKLESICVFGCRLELADGSIAIPGMRFISFSIFIFGTGSRFQPMTTVHPQTSHFPLNILLFHATCTPSVFKSPFPHTHHESLTLQKPSLLFLQAAL
jgi:hypothetical protein